MSPVAVYPSISFLKRPSPWAVIGWKQQTPIDRGSELPNAQDQAYLHELQPVNDRMSERPYSLNNGSSFVKVDEGELVYTPTPPSKPRLVTLKGYYALHESIEASKGEDKGPSAHAS
ncbi:hypothetical protein CSPX01_09717 [Colletotrichum filicis]|nr:hypothetical protein CSPX01_09717 [Colletotrichum filicis]